MNQHLPKSVRNFSRSLYSTEAKVVSDSSSKGFLEKADVGASKLLPKLTAGAAVGGLVALTYYGISQKPGSIADNSKFWSPHVKERVNSIYGHFAAAIALSGASASVAWSSTAFRLAVMRNPWVYLVRFTC